MDSFICVLFQYSETRKAFLCLANISPLNQNFAVTAVLQEDFPKAFAHFPLWCLLRKASTFNTS